MGHHRIVDCRVSCEHLPVSASRDYASVTDHSPYATAVAGFVCVVGVLAHKTGKEKSVNLKSIIRPDPIETRFFEPDYISVRPLNIGERRPFLPLPANVLPFVSTNPAFGRRLVHIGELSAAGGADEVGHTSCFQLVCR